jgi:TfoX/Sxy family transcriptional regulator of competence genes
MSKLTVILLTSMVMAGNSYGHGEDIEVDESTGIKLVEKGLAKPKNKKKYEDAVKRIEAIKQQELEKEEQIKALKEEEELKALAREKAEELLSLLEKVSLADPNYPAEIVEMFKTLESDETGNGNKAD